MDFEILIGIFPQVLIDGITLGFMASARTGPLAPASRVRSRSKKAAALGSGATLRTVDENGKGPALGEAGPLNLEPTSGGLVLGSHRCGTMGGVSASISS